MDKIEMTLETAQKEVGEWALRNFGEQDSHRPLLGIFEELGEYAAARDQLDRDSMRDAIGDIGVYLLHYCSIRGWSASELWDNRVGPTGTDMGVIRSLSHHHLKGAQNIRGGAAKHDYYQKHELSMLLWRLDQASIDVGGDFLCILYNTWEMVKQRDWKKNPNNADKVVEEPLGVDKDMWRHLDAAVEESRCADTLRPEEELHKQLDAQQAVDSQRWREAQVAEDAEILRQVELFDVPGMEAHRNG